MFFKKYKNSKIVRKQCEAKSIFLNVSHGSRSGKSCHTALNDIRTWKSCTWFVKLDIDMFFGEVNQKRLLNILSESIDDELVMNLIQQMFNVFSNKSISSSEFFQDNLFSCFLCNVYLHKLDEFIIKKRHEIWDKNDIIKFAAPQTEEWKKAINIDVEELKSCKSFHQKRVLKRTLMNEKKKKARKMGLVRYTLADEQKAVVGAKVFDTIYYVRYLDEFLLGIKGLKSLAADIKKKISQYIKSDLQLALISSELYNVKSSKVRYLGFDISVLDVKNNRTLKLKKIIAFKKLRNKIKLKKKIVENR